MNVRQDHTPNNTDIVTYKEAVPKWGNELNVCSIETIKEIQ